MVVEGPPDINLFGGSACSPKCIRVGMDFAGLGTVYIAANKLARACNRKGSALEMKHVFSCDKLRASKLLIHHHFPPGEWQNDIKKRDVANTPDCDVYSFTAPCQAHSLLGKRKGFDDDARSQLLIFALEYIETKKPKCVISENVAQVKTDEKFMSLTIAVLTKNGYVFEFNDVNTHDYNVPQSRTRLYLIAIRQDCLRSKTCGVNWWPDPVPCTAPIRNFIRKLPDSEFQMLPQHKLHHDNVTRAYEKVVQLGKNPFGETVIIDMKSSETFSGLTVGVSPTLTRTRCSGLGYWCSYKGGVLSIADMCALQGFDADELDFAGCCVSDAAAGGLIGNAQSLNVVNAILPHMLFLSQLITKKEFLVMKAFNKTEATRV